MSNKYELKTLKDIFDKVPADRLDVCMQELCQGIKQAQAARQRMEVVAQMLGGGKDNVSAFWPETSTWVDDGLGNVTTVATVEIVAPEAT